MEYITDKKDFKAISGAIDKLKTLKKKLQYFNDNCGILILKGVSKTLSVQIFYDNDSYTIYCTCKDCEGKYSVSDFEVYRDFVNNQTDTIVKYFNSITSYKAKLEYFYKLTDNEPIKSKLVLHYVPNSKEELDHSDLEEVVIDVRPQNEAEFNILLDFRKSILLDSENNKNLINRGAEYFNPSGFIFENRADEVLNYLELTADKKGRKDLIKKYLDSIDLDKLDKTDFEKVRIKGSLTPEFCNYEILQMADKIIRKINYDEVVDITDFFEVQKYLLAVETIRFKKHLNSLLVSKPLETNLNYEPTKAELLKDKLNQYKFDSLNGVTESNKTDLINIIANSNLPFQIAYLDYLGFIKFLNDNYCKNSNKELHKLIAEILTTNERAVRGNINGIRNIKSEDRKRYTAYQHQEEVTKHYATLK